MGQVKEINIKKKTYYFFNDMINIEVFGSNLLKIEKKSYKNIDIYYSGYIRIKKNWWLRKYLQCKYFGSDHWWSRWTYWKENGSKYSIFDSTGENKEVLEKYAERWKEIENKIKTINGSKKSEYRKDFMKIIFGADDNLSLNKSLKLRMLTIIVRSVFEEDETFAHKFI